MNGSIVGWLIDEHFCLPSLLALRERFVPGRSFSGSRSIPWPVGSLEMTAIPPRADRDTQLLARARDGDRDAFNELVGRLYLSVREYLRHREPLTRPSDLEDMTQEVFARTWRFMSRYRGQASARTYLFAIANHVLSEQRRGSRKARCVGGEVDIPAVERRDSPTEVRELLAIVGRALGELTTKQKDAFNLVLINEQPIREVAAREGASVKAIRRRAEAARVRLRQSLSACKTQCCYDCPSFRACPAEAGRTSCLKFLIRKYL